MWKSVRTTSSMCSGVLTAEMALGAVVSIVNKSKLLDFRVDIRTVAVWDTNLVFEIQVTPVAIIRIDFI